MLHMLPNDWAQPTTLNSNSCDIRFDLELYIDDTQSAIMLD